MGTTVTAFEVGYYDKDGFWWCYESAPDLFMAREYAKRLSSGYGGARATRKWQIVRKVTQVTFSLVDDAEES
jgi:hypothetical protein